MTFTLELVLDIVSTISLDFFMLMIANLMPTNLIISPCYITWTEDLVPIGFLYQKAILWSEYNF